jgi:GNAT superfamily N-acetyltransferase
MGDRQMHPAGGEPGDGGGAPLPSEPRLGGARTAPAIVRPAGRGDLDTLVAFNAAMALETEGRALDEARLRRGVERALLDAARGSYRVALRDGVVVGALLLTREWSDWRDGWFWWIQSVYVVPAARGTGVYRALHASVLDEARRDGEVCGIRLYVEQANRAAQATYAAVGMARTHYLLFEQDFTL